MWILGNSDLILRIIFVLILIWAWLKYFEVAPWNKINFKKLIWGTIAVRIALVLAETTLQYIIWAKGEFSKVFIASPNPGILNFKGGYFIFYAWNRFWLTAVLGILTAWIFYKFLAFLKKRQERFFKEGEVELGFLAALLAGWPDFAVFIPLFLVFTVIIAVLRQIIFKEKYTTLGLPLLLAASAILALEPYFSSIFGLTALRP
jgi:hypothetical protein